MFNMDDMSKMLGNIGDMQKNAEKLKAELASKTYTVKSGGGLVELSVNGNGEVIDLIIDDTTLTDKDMLQILLIGAINDANKMVLQNQQSSAMNMLGGMNPFGAK